MLLLLILDEQLRRVLCFSFLTLYEELRGILCEREGGEDK